MSRRAYLYPLWLTGLCVVILLGSGARVSVAQETVLDRVQAAFAEGNAQALLAEASDRIEVALLGQSKLYSRAQATLVLHHFFKRFTPEQFNLQSQSQAEGTWFATGEYHYKYADQPLQVYLRLRVRGGTWELSAIHIEEHPRS